VIAGLHARTRRAGFRVFSGGAIFDARPVSLSIGVAEAMAIVRLLDLVVLALALPVFVLAGWPLAGYGAGAGAWLAQRGIQVGLARRARETDDPRVVAGITAGSMIGRGWLVALTIFVVGVAVDRDAGLAAAVLVIVLFTVYFTVSMIMRPFDAAEGRR
jgi:hypothetical protein